MKQDITKNERVVITDECGDTMWDEVLQQDVKNGEVKDVSESADSLLNNVTAVKVCGATKAESLTQRLFHKD